MHKPRLSGSFLYRDDFHPSRRELDGPRPPRARLDLLETDLQDDGLRDWGSDPCGARQKNDRRAEKGPSAEGLSPGQGQRAAVLAFPRLLNIAEQNEVF